VWGGSRTIGRQKNELELRVRETERLLQQNTDLTNRLKSAARRTTTLNEEYLKQIAAELHDGPAQDIGYALLDVGGAPGTGTQEPGVRSVSILRRALEEIRDISSGLRSPDLDDMTLREVVNRALAVHKNRTGCTVSCEFSSLPETVDLAAKITLYRVLQEALSNAHRHADDSAPEVNVSADDTFVTIRVSDTGPGVDHHAITGRDGRVHLGLAVMQERVELLAGEFTVKPNQPIGTVIEARIPVTGDR